MADITPEQYDKIHKTLIDCASRHFANDNRLRYVFNNYSVITPFAIGLPEANSKEERIQATIYHLKGKYHKDKRNALALFLRILARRISKQDTCYDRLISLANEIDPPPPPPPPLPKELPNFDIAIYEANGHYFKTWFPPDESQHPPVPFQLTDKEELRQQVVSIRAEYLQVKAETIRPLGSQLFSALLGGQTAPPYTKTSLESLRLRISAELPELSYIPWELLYDSSQQHYLALHGPVSVVRYIPTGKPRQENKIAGPLRILYVSAAPADLPELDTESNKTNFYQSIYKMLTTKQVEVKPLEYATPEDLRKELQTGVYHILHYEGHGGFNDYLKQGYLALEDEDGNSKPLFGKQLATFIEGKQLLFAFLSACDTTVASASAPLTGVAQQLVKVGGLPAALAMQFSVRNEMASVFTTHFYRLLAEKGLKELDEAIKEARKAVVAKLLDYEQSLDWAAPVLFLQSEMRPRVKGYVTTDSLLIMLNQSHEDWFLTVKNIGTEKLSRINILLRPTAAMLINNNSFRFPPLLPSKCISKAFSLTADFSQTQELSLKINGRLASGRKISTTAEMSL